MAANLTFQALLISIFLWIGAVHTAPEAGPILRSATQGFRFLPPVTSLQIERSEKPLLKPVLAGKWNIFKEMSFYDCTD